MFLKSWVSFIHIKALLNHSAVLIWNLDLASTRSSVHSARIVRIVNSLMRNAISISNGLFSWDMRWGAYIFQPRKVNLPQKAPFLSTNRDALPVNIRLIVCSEHNYVHARIDNITLGGHGRRSLLSHMIWYDMIWYDIIWYDMIWYDIIWYDIRKFYHIISYDIIWYHMISKSYDIIIWYDIRKFAQNRQTNK